MLDIKFVRENPELVRENIKRKFQDAKLPLVDEVIELDKEIRSLKVEGEGLRASRNELSKQIGQLMRNKEIDKANEVKATVAKNNARIAEIDPLLTKLEEEVDEIKRHLTSQHFLRLSVGECKMELSAYYHSTVSGFERVGDHLINIGYSILNPTGSQAIARKQKQNKKTEKKPS